MLVLTRKFQQQIKIGDQITVTILRVKGQTVRVGIDAPRDVRVLRGELPPVGQGEVETAENEGVEVAVTLADEQEDETTDGATEAKAASNTPVAPLAVLASRLARRKIGKRDSAPLRVALVGAAEALAK